MPSTAQPSQDRQHGAAPDLGPVPVDQHQGIDGGVHRVAFEQGTALRRRKPGEAEHGPTIMPEDKPDRSGAETAAVVVEEDRMVDCWFHFPIEGLPVRRLLPLLALLIWGCGGGTPTVTPPPPPPPAPTVDHVVIDNGDIAILVGDSRQLQVRPLTASGDLVSDATVTYSSSDPLVASVSSTALVHGVAEGTATITATSAGKSASITVTVRLPVVATVQVTIRSQTVKVNDTTRATAVARDSADHVLDRPVTWSSGDTSLVVVGPTGLVLGLKPGGPVQLTATIGGKSASVAVSIIPAAVASLRIHPDSATLSPGDSAQFSVEVTDEFGGNVQNPTVLWASLAPQVATVSGSGLVKAVQLGGTIVYATVNGVTAQSIVNVSQPDVAKYQISVNNHLRYSIRVTENANFVGEVAANSIGIIQLAVVPSAVIGWTVVEPNSHGEPMGESLPAILNPTGTIPIDVSNVLRNGKVYFTPQVRDLSGSKVQLFFPIVEQAFPCLCFASPLDVVPREDGYWLLTPQTTMELYQSDDLNRTGPKLVIPVPAVDVEPLTGVWRYTILIAP